jgi:hypothetical protein
MNAKDWIIKRVGGICLIAGATISLGLYILDRPTAIPFNGVSTLEENLGTVDNKALVHLQMHFFNGVGRKLTEVLPVSACSCIKLKAGVSVIDQDGVLPVDITVDAEPVDQTTVFEREAAIMWDGGGTQPITFKFKVIPDFEISPSVIDLGSLDDNAAEKEFTFKISSNRGESLSKIPLSDNSHVRVTNLQRVSSTECVVTASFDPVGAPLSFDQNQIHEAFNLLVDGKKLTPVPMEADAKVRHSIVATPVQINLGFVNQGENITKTVDFRSTAKEGIIRVTSDDPLVSCELKRTGSDSYQMTVSCKAGFPAGTVYRSTIKVFYGASPSSYVSYGLLGLIPYPAACCQAEKRFLAETQKKETNEKKQNEN